VFVAPFAAAFFICANPQFFARDSGTLKNCAQRQCFKFSYACRLAKKVFPQGCACVKTALQKVKFLAAKKINSPDYPKRTWGNFLCAKCCGS